MSDESKLCRSPISGVVVRISAQVGQTIQVHDVLMVLEAMKMETSITSPIAGKVAKVNVHVGDAVVGVNVEGLLPGLPAVGRHEDSALLVRPEGVPYSADVDDVRVARVD